MKVKRIVVECCRVLLGLVFVFSGFVKAVDPLGTAYKIHDYLEAWGLSSFYFLDLPVSIVQSVVEFTLGVLLLLGVYRKYASLLLLLIMCFMTPLTLYVALYNPVSDCGCFGDALLLTNWQTFYKNIVLLIAAIIVVWSNCHCGRAPQSPPKKGVSVRALWTAIITVLLITGLTLYCLVYLPIIDFRPYKIGNNIKELSIIPEGAPSDEYETTLIYAKDGVAQKFTMENYPKEGSGWEFVDSEIKLVKKGYEPPIHNFTITTGELPIIDPRTPDSTYQVQAGIDVTEQILDYPGYTFLVIAHKLENAAKSGAPRLNEIANYAIQNGHHFLGLTASLPKQIADWSTQTKTLYPFCTTDDITLKTIVRSNPGLVLMHNATIIGKWSHNNLPGEKELNKLTKNI
ncbi:MAG: DoxX family membrane protein [Candidatus Symbiothrix sp.]|nr:DoxX family membrane protein [Candidatus Symbiothrix sp.]